MSMDRMVASGHRLVKIMGLRPHVVLKWCVISMTCLFMIAYLSVEFFLHSSYKNMAAGAYRAAAQDSSLALNIANFLYPASSEHLQEIFSHSVMVWSKFGILGTSFGEGADNFTVAQSLRFEHENKDGLTPEVLAKIRIDGARIANATTYGQGVDALVTAIINKSLPANPVLMAYAKEESAYHDLAVFFATLKPKDMKDKMLNDSVIEWAMKDHEAAQVTICANDVAQCRFNNLRWKIGGCIRRAYLNETPACTAEILREVTQFPSACGKGLTIDQCYSIMNGLLPYYHHLLKAQGSRVKIIEK